MRKNKVASEYIDASMMLYRRTRTKAKELLGEAQKAGYSQIIIDGEGEIAEICQLTCLELGVVVVQDRAPDVPILRVLGRKLALIWPESLETRDERESNKEEQIAI